VTARYQQVETLAATHPVAVLCPLLGVSRSGYYDWRGRAPSRRQCEDAHLVTELRAAFAHSRQTYGRPRLTHVLNRGPRRYGQRRIGRLMRLAGLQARRRRGFRPQTTQSRHDGPIAPNRLAERPTPPSRPNEVWAVDLTYLPTTEGWLFLAIVLDLYSRRVVGWAFADTLHTALPVAALRMALHQRQPSPGLLHHSDRGCQYASAEYRQWLATYGLLPSMSRTGNPYDNAQVESFFSTLKTEALHGPLTSRADTKARLFAFLESFYNRVRLHSALGFLSPVDFENLNH
jgi:putative transposase